MEVTPQEQARVRKANEAIVRARIKGQFAEARERVAARKEVEVRKAQPRFLLAPIPGVKREVTGRQLARLSLIPGVGTFVQQEAVRQLFIRGIEKGEAKLAKHPESVAAGFALGALGVAKFPVKHPLITTGIIIAPQLAGAVAVKAGVSAGIVAGVSKGVLIGAGGVTVGFGVKEFKEAPTEIAKGKALFNIAAGAVMITGGAVSLARQFVKPKITRIDTTAVAKETIKVDKKTKFEIAARAKVGVKKFLGRERFKQVEVAGESITQPSLRPGFFESKARFAARIKGRKDIVSIGKVSELIKTEGKITKGVSATQIKPPTPKGKIQRFISAKVGFKAAETPKGELQLTTGRTVELLKGKIGKPFTERGITIIKRIPKETPQEFGFGMVVRPTVKPSVPSPTIGGVEQVVRETVMKTITPTPRPIPSAPITKATTSIIREVTPSKFEGLGLYERTEEVAVVTPKGMEQLQLTRIKVKEEFLLKPRAIEAIKTKTATMGITAVATETIQLTKPVVITKPITTQAQAKAQAFAGAVPSAQTLIGEVPARPLAPFGFDFRPGGFKKAGRRLGVAKIRRQVIFTPSLVAQEFGVTATRAERKQIRPVAVFGVRPLPTGLGIKRKKALFQDIGI